MPINQDGAFESIRFEYQHETDESFVLQVEYHKTDIGPTVTIHNLLDTGALSLPLSVYVDVVDYLRGRGSIPGGVVAAKVGTQTARPTTKLAPTRVAGASIPKPIVQTAPAPRHTDAVFEQAFAAQTSILTTGAATVVGPAIVPPKAVTPPVNLSVEPIVVLEPTNIEGLDPMFSLESAKSRKAAGDGGRFKKTKRLGSEDTPTE